MKTRRLFAMGFALAMTAFACSPASQPANASAAMGGDEDVVAAISQLEKDWVVAIEKKDAAAVERLLAADFVGTSPTAHNYTATQAVDDLKAGRYVVEKMTIDEVT